VYIRAAEQSSFPTANNGCWLECAENSADFSDDKFGGINIGARRLHPVCPSWIIVKLPAMAACILVLGNHQMLVVLQTMWTAVYPK